MKIILTFTVILFSCSVSQVAPELPPTTAPPSAIEQPKIPEGKNGCTERHWKDRGYMPAGAYKGIIAMYQKAIKENHPVYPIISTKSSRGFYQDALKQYGLDGKNLRRQTFAMLLGLSMRESNANYTLGRDYTAKGTQSSLTAESGMWQFSMDAIGADPELRKIYDKSRQPGYDCMSGIFREGLLEKSHATCVKSPKNPKCVRTDGYITSPASGAEFQRHFRSCPAAQVEYAAVMIRRNSAHFGPLNRKEVEYVKACEDLLASYE